MQAVAHGRRKDLHQRLRRHRRGPAPAGADPLQPALLPPGEGGVGRRGGRAARAVRETDQRRYPRSVAAHLRLHRPDAARPVAERSGGGARRRRVRQPHRDRGAAPLGRLLPAAGDGGARTRRHQREGAGDRRSARPLGPNDHGAALVELPRERGAGERRSGGARPRAARSTFARRTSDWRARI